MDGLGLKFAKNPLEGNFEFDEYGALVPASKNLQMEKVQADISRQLRAKTGLFKRLTDTYYRTDVEFTDNPTGNTPTLGVGIKLYGKRPIQSKFKDKSRRASLGRTASEEKALEKREAKIVKDQEEYMALHKSLEPTDKTSSEYVQWLVEGDQVMTGGGFDNNSVGDVQLSALKFVIKGNTNVSFGGNPFSKMVVQGALWLKDQLKSHGLREGSLVPVGCSKVRMEQDNDGMIGYPVYSKGWAECTPDIAQRLLLASGVDVRPYVGRDVVDPRTGESVKYNVVSAIAHVLDNLIINDPSDFPSVITLLARIQKHGWKKEKDQLVPKKSKTRSVYPNGAIPGMIEAMVGTPFIKELQRLKCPFMPSLLDKQNRVEILKNLMQHAHAEGYEGLSLDESQYDATVIGGAFATIMYLAIRPFFNAKYYDWVDFAIYCLCYKYILCDTALCSINPDEFKDAKESGPWVEVGPFTVFGMTSGLISGAKLTHVGGSFYGGVVIHFCIAMLLGFKPLLGVQAGDDCVFFIPRTMVDFTSMEKTYAPVEAAAKAVGIEINALKQIWFVVSGELVNIFLQDVYHEASNTWGPGSSFRPLDSVFFSERDKGLSVGLQYMAEHARMNQGADGAFIEPCVRTWLSKEQYIGSLYKELGEGAFKLIVQSTNMTTKEIMQSIEVGSFTYGVNREDLENGSLPIVPIIAKVASTMDFTVSFADAQKSLGEGVVGADAGEDYVQNDVSPDIGDSDDMLAD